MLASKTLKSLLLAGSLLSYSLSAEPLADLLKSATFFTEGTGEEFMSEYKGLGFRWNSAAKASARSLDRDLVVDGNKVGETIVFFKEGKPSLIQISIYNRGDDKLLTGSSGLEKFNSTLTDWAAILDEVTGVEKVRRGRDNKSAVKADGVIWSLPDRAYLLEYSSTGRSGDFEGQFIRLRVAPVVQQSFLEEKMAEEKTTAAKASLPDNVVREDGDVYISGIPMVDQGGKGYCAVATAARVFNYYGVQVTMHELAQLAGADPNQGTNSTLMLEQIGKLAGRFKTRVKEHDALEYSDMTDLSEDYNRAAKKMDKRLVPESDNYNHWGNFDRFDPEVLKAARLRSGGDLAKFEREVYRSIDAGIPLLWGVTVGIFEEPKWISQSRGGHMRLIIGYNADDRTIMFSDSWGAGHERKVLGMDEAFCMTHGLHSIQPIK